MTGMTAPSMEIGATRPRYRSPKWVLPSLPPVGLSLLAMYCIMTSRGLTPRTSMEPEVADERPDDVLRLEGVGAAHRGRLLAAAGVEPAHHLALPVEIAQPVLDHPVELHEVVELELPLARQLGLRQPLGLLHLAGGEDPSSCPDLPFVP